MRLLASALTLALLTASCGSALKRSDSEVGLLPVRSTAFAEALEGVWLVGWSGDLEHYSWVRFASAMAGSGVADVLSGAGILANLPLWTCSGKGSWARTAKPNTVQIVFPTSCSLANAGITFVSFEKTTGFRAKADLSALITVIPSVSGFEGFEGFHFPSAQCNAAMTTCASPF